MKPYGAIPSQAPHKRGRCIDYPEREYSNLLGEAPRIQFLDDDIVSAIGNNGISVRSGFLVRIQVSELIRVFLFLIVLAVFNVHFFIIGSRQMSYI